MQRLSALLGVLVLAGCASYSPPDLALVGLAPLESTLFEPRMRLDFRLENPNRRPLKVRGVNLKLEVNGIELARGVDELGFVLPAFGESRASVEVSASLFNVIQLVLSLPTTETFSYQLGGRLHLAGVPGGLPISRGGAISRDQLLALTGAGGRQPAPLRLE